MKIFLICPVRNASASETESIAKYVGDLEQAGELVYWPARDTKQNDPTGVRICTHNRQALAEADEVHVWWSPESKGSHFDLGMAWALRKPIKAANEIARTPAKSYSNFLCEVAQ